MEALHERYERELGNELGNLLSRSTAMVSRYREGLVPERPADSPLRDLLDGLGHEVASRIDRFDLSGAVDEIWHVVRALNRHVEEQAPWQLAKEPERARELDSTLYDLVDGLRAVAVALASYLPETAPRILEALGQRPDLSWAEVAWGRSQSGVSVEPAAPLFPRVESPLATE